MELDTKIFLLSVPHTGTRFMLKVFQDAGLYRNTHVIHTHFDGYGHWKNLDPDLVRPMPKIITLRDKETVRKSWIMRKRTEPNFEKSYDDMDEFISTHDDIFTIHIDNPDTRDAELRAISDRIGVELVADFDVKIGECPQ